MSYAPTIIPGLRYDDAQTAITFLTTAFGFEVVANHEADDGTVEHAELRWRSGMVMLGQTSDGDDGRMPGKQDFAGIYVVVEDIQASYDRIVRAGGEVTGEPSDTPYGSKEFGAKDTEGNLWWFGDYQPTATTT